MKKKAMEDEDRQKTRAENDDLTHPYEKIINNSFLSLSPASGAGGDGPHGASV